MTEQQNSSEKLQAYNLWLSQRLERKQARKPRNQLKSLAISLIKSKPAPEHISNEQVDRSPQNNQSLEGPIISGNHLDSSRIVSPDKLSSEQFLQLIQSNIPYMKYSKLAPMHSNTNYHSHYIKQSMENDSKLHVPQFDYRNSLEPVSIQTSSRAEYRPIDLSLRNRINRSKAKIPKEQIQVSYDSEYHLRFKQQHASPSISMKPSPRPFSLPPVEQYSSCYRNSYDAKQASTEQIEKNKGSRNSSTLKSLIQKDMSLNDSSVYKQSFQQSDRSHLYNDLRGHRSARSQSQQQTTIITPNYQNHFKSVAQQDYIKHQRQEKRDEQQELVRLISIMQGKSN